MNKHFSRGSSSVELSILVPLLVLFLVIGIDFGRMMHARSTIANAVYVATQKGWNEFYTFSPSWIRDTDQSVVVNDTILDAMDLALDANKGPYALVSPITHYLCQCQNPATQIVECNVSGIKSCGDGNLKIFLKVSAGASFDNIFGPLTSINKIGPLSVTSRVK